MHAWGDLLLSLNAESQLWEDAVPLYTCMHVYVICFCVFHAVLSLGYLNFHDLIITIIIATTTILNGIC